MFLCDKIVIYILLSYVSLSTGVVSNLNIYIYIYVRTSDVSYCKAVTTKWIHFREGLKKPMILIRYSTYELKRLIMVLNFGCSHPQERSRIMVDVFGRICIVPYMSC